MRRPATVEALLGPGGLLSVAMPGYEHRPQQLTMALAVEKALAERSYLVVEAGTGTGKTLAYLVPAALSGRRVVVSTATKTLQEQIFFKDIPFLRSALGLEFEAAYLKGRANYLCLLRFEQFDQAPTFTTRDEAERWPAIREWAKQTQSGDRAELDLPEAFPAWASLSTTSETCLGSRCPLYEPCFVTQMRKRAEGADVVVVNHALFFADVALKSAKGEGVLPPYQAVVFDEAHALEDAATDHFGMQVSSRRVEELGTDALKALPDGDERKGMLSALALKAQGHAAEIFRAIPRAAGPLGDGTQRLPAGGLKGLRPQMKDLLEALAALTSFTAGAEEPELLALMRRSGQLAEELDFIQRAESDAHVFCAEQRGRGVLLRASPIDVAAEMRERVFKVVDTAVFTSATLRAEGRFDYFTARVGLRGEAADELPRVRELGLESPFDFPHQAALYLAPRLPDPNSPGFIEAFAEEVVALTAVTGGRAFVLCTSLKNMQAAHALAGHRLPYQVLLQGERPKSALLEAFRSQPSVLFASHSFWEGVDVPGDALSLVIIDRLPFASPGDPLVAARIEQLKARGEEPFSAFQLPAAALSLRQGFGRLIRSRKDRGIVAILDPRIATKSYGRSFLKSLPPARKVLNLEDLKRWFDEA